MGTEVKTGDKQANIAFISIKDSSMGISSEKDTDKGRIVVDDNPDAIYEESPKENRSCEGDDSNRVSKVNTKEKDTTHSKIKGSIKDKNGEIKVEDSEKGVVSKEEKKRGFCLTDDIIMKGLRDMMKEDVTPLPKKTAISYITAASLRDLIKQVNGYNEFYPDYPILREDVVSVLKEGEGYVLLYYRYSK